jgi:hypothetical protein
MPKDKETSRKSAPKTLFEDFETAEELAKGLIKDYHPHLLTANIKYMCRDKASKKAGLPVAGVVTKNSPKNNFLMGGVDFVVDIALEVWNNLDPKQRKALVDHLLTRCTGEEDEETGEMKWGIIPPQVQEFSEVAERHGRWNDGLQELGQALDKK